MSSASPAECRNTLVAPNIYLGPDSSVEFLLENKISRMFRFYAGVHYLTIHPQDGWRHLGKNEYDYLKDFEVLCSLLEEIISEGENVFFHVREEDEETDTSRAYTLLQAWRIHNGRRDKGGSEIVSHHKEQLRVWNAMLADWHQKSVIYWAWKGDIEKGQRWQGVGLPGTQKLMQQIRRCM